MSTQAQELPNEGFRHATSDCRRRERGRSAQTLLGGVGVRKGSTTRRAVWQGCGIYAFTAPLVVEAVEQILNARLRPNSALAPGDAFAFDGSPPVPGIRCIDARAHGGGRQKGKVPWSGLAWPDLAWRSACAKHRRECQLQVNGCKTEQGHEIPAIPGRSSRERPLE
jgi:hypothetical protein